MGTNLFCCLQYLTVDDSKSYVSLVGVDCFFLRKLGVNCGADDDEVVDCVYGAAIDFCGLKTEICKKSGMSLKASSYMGFFVGIRIFKNLATLLVVEMQEWRTDTDIICLSFRYFGFPAAEIFLQWVLPMIFDLLFERFWRASVRVLSPSCGSSSFFLWSYT